MKKMRFFGLAALTALWAVLTVCAWFGPAKDFSDAERRKLAQFPELSVKTVLDGKFMTEFESYTLDQFPLRDSFRQLKAQFHYNALGQKDNNGIYILGDHIIKQEYPLDSNSLNRAASRFGYLHDRYLKGLDANIVMAVVPDKGMYLGHSSGHLQLDADVMMQLLEKQMPWATHVDLTGCLSADDYYRTDTHWNSSMWPTPSVRLWGRIELILRHIRSLNWNVPSTAFITVRRQFLWSRIRCIF